MEQVRIYRPSLRFIYSHMGVGIIFFFFLLMGTSDGISLPLIIGFLFSFSVIGNSLYYLRKRQLGQGYYWDEEGVVVNFKGNKVYWNEIEKIEFLNRRGKTTIIYPRYNCIETILERHKKYVPAMGYAMFCSTLKVPMNFTQG